MIAATMGVNAQTMINWDEEGKFIFHAEDFVGEGSIKWDEDEAAFVCSGEGPGKLMLNLDGKTIDFSEVASIEVTGNWFSNDKEGNFGPGAWNGNDPLASIVINDAVSGKINEWMGSRYSINYKGLADKGDFKGKPYYSISTKIDALYFTARESVAGLIYIEDFILTKIPEQDTNAIAPLYHVWDGFDENAQIKAEPGTVGFEDNIGKVLTGGGAVVIGNGSVSGELYADLSDYAGIYIKGTPKLGLRLLFNRPTPTQGITECNPVLDENGECSFMFTELTKKEIESRGEAYPFVHLNTVKLPWSLPEGTLKIQKFNFIEKGGSSVDAIIGEDSDNALYNVFGQRVDENYRGIVIKNGKKYIKR